jgi:hypothetical protein
MIGSSSGGRSASRRLGRLRRLGAELVLLALVLVVVPTLRMDLIPVGAASLPPAESHGANVAPDTAPASPADYNSI